MPRLAAPVLALALLAGLAGSASAVTLRPVADASVSAAAPRQATGNAKVLRVGPGRRDRAFLRFAVPALNGTVSAVTLRLRASTARPGGVGVYALPAGSKWTERRLRFRNAPRGGSLVGQVERVRRGKLDLRLNVARLRLAAGQPLNLAIAARGKGRAVSFSSREARSRAPRLLIVVTPAPPPTPPPDTTPPAVTVTAPAAGASTDGQPTFAGTAEPGQVTVQVAPAGGGAAIATYTAAVNAAGQWAVRPSTPLPPGAQQVTAAERDAAGNLGTSATVPFAVIATIAAAGDIACPPGAGTDATHCQQQATSNLVVDQGYQRILALGDNQYDNGTLSAFTGSFDPTWGRAKNLISPVAGNHEYQDPAGGAQGYFDYFNRPGQTTGPAGTRGEGWYDFTFGGWHFIALNSDCTFIPAGGAADGCATGSPQETWLRGALAASTAPCTLVYWHHPRYSSGNGGDAAGMQAIWQDVATAHADLVLNGHSHGYERFVPMNGAGVADDAGVQEIVVGTGGDDFFPMTGEPNTAKMIPNVFGVLRLTLHASSYDWRFVPIAGSTATDSGTRSCH